MTLQDYESMKKTIAEFERLAKEESDLDYLIRMIDDGSDVRITVGGYDYVIEGPGKMETNARSHISYALSRLQTDVHIRTLSLKLSEES